MGSPYYITYQNNPVLYDYITVSLKIWHGEFYNIPAEPTYELTAYRTSSSSSAYQSLYIDISSYVADFIDPIPNSVWFEQYEQNQDYSDYREVVNVKYQMDVWKSNGEKDPFLVESFDFPMKCATLGYGYPKEGPNPQPSSYQLVDNATKSVAPSQNYYTIKLATDAYASWNVFDRQPDNISTFTCSGKYKPMQIMYLDKNGILDVFTFPKSSKRSITFKSEDYKRMKDRPFDYNFNEHSEVSYNKNGVEKYEVNTDLLNENNVIYIEQLMASDRHWLVDYENYTFHPLNLKDTEFMEKTSINDKAKISYTLKFEAATPYKQNY